jgi:hypothetical protein
MRYQLGKEWKKLIGFDIIESMPGTLQDHKDFKDRVGDSDNNRLGSYLGFNPNYADEELLNTARAQLAARDNLRPQGSEVQGRGRGCLGWLLGRKERKG